MRIRWGSLGGQLGIGYCLAGIVLIFLGWNGAASYDRVESQMPYLISGGLAGIALVIIGAGLLVVQAQRANRAAVEAEIGELREAVDRLAGASGGAAPRVSGGTGDLPVVVGPRAYHRPDCRLVEGQMGAPPTTLTVAQERGREACRVGGPDS
jgi:hypothetical protein